MTSQSHHYLPPGADAESTPKLREGLLNNSRVNSDLSTVKRSPPEKV
jgi:hypothetical protein